MPRVFEQSVLFKDIRDAIFDDGYIFGIIHGPPRCSKSTLGLHAGYSVYEDWPKVLGATVFNLPAVIQRMKDGKPERWPTSNGAHTRVPYLLWDEFKAAFDVLGTKIGVLMLTAVDAGSATQQLQGKYNIEVFLTSKGKYKYDKVHWRQDYKGFRVMMKKECIEYGEFNPIPKEIYKEYDEMRMELTDQAFVRLEDAMANDTLDALMKLLKPSDIQLIRLIDTLGPLRHETAKEKLGEDYKVTLTRCKARSIIIPTSLGNGHYKLDLSSIGRDILEALDGDSGKEKAKQTVKQLA